MSLSLKKNKSSAPMDDSWFDETMQSPAVLKKEWQVLLNNLNGLGAEEVLHRRAELQKRLTDNGVTYNVYNGHTAMARTWKLDPIPWVLTANDWLAVEKGLVQRAELLNLILKDLYGPKELIRKGLLPHEMIFCHRGYLRPCDGIVANSAYPLAIYAADIARGPDGRMWLVNDRTQAPSGIGYALENRSAMVHVMPELFRQQQVAKISDFFYTYYNSFCQLAQKENPRIALLTPGDRNETYFEHALLSDHLGLSLVQGPDLLVKDSFLWIKTIHGLEKVDVLIRRVDDIFCDPLEFRPDSRLGVAGLLEVVRKGNVVVANPFGSGILENPALIPYLNTICRHYFQQDLLMPSVATWWCGKAKDKEFVLTNLDTLIVKKIDRYTGNPTLIPSQMSRYEIGLLKDKIQAEPYLYVGQEKVTFSALPSFINHHIESRFAVLRGFAVAGNNGYQLMPGGLTRSSTEKGTFTVSNQAGGASKDTWILTEKEDSSLQSTAGQLFTPVRPKESLTSRMAENLFWSGRYSERVLATLRVMKTNLLHLMEDPSSESHSLVKDRLLCALTQMTKTYPGFVGKENAYKREQPLETLFALAQNELLNGSLMFNLRNLIQAMQSVGGFLSNDSRRMVENVKENAAAIRQLKVTGYLNLNDALDKLYNSLVSLLGFITESMPREQGWLMFQTGRKVERSLLITSLVRSVLVFIDPPAAEQQLLEAVLKSNQLISTYRYKFRTQLHMEYALELLLFDQHNPRSIAYQLQKLLDYLQQLVSEDAVPVSGNDQKLIAEAIEQLVHADRTALARSSQLGFLREKLDTLLSETDRLLGAASASVVQKYFSHTEVVNMVTTSNEPSV